MAYRRKQGALATGDHRTAHPQDSFASLYGYTSMKSLNEPKLGLWGTLARKAKGILDEDAAAHKLDDYTKHQQTQKLDSSNGAQAPPSRWLFENHQKTENTASRTRSEALAASVNQLGGRIRNALEEGLTIVDNKAANIIGETKKIQIRRKSSGSSSNFQNQAADTFTRNFSQNQAETEAQETQLKASLDVANAMAAKAKLLLRELKTVKADLSFAKQRCSQLKEENKLLRDTNRKGAEVKRMMTCLSSYEPLSKQIRVQLEALLAEKSRLAQENSMYARENRFLREIVEFHQFTTHDVVSFDDGETKDCNMEDGINHTYTPNVLTFIEDDASHEELSPVPSSPGSPILNLGEQLSPKFSNPPSNVSSLPSNPSVSNTV